jgi:hypothetical protein
VLAEETVNLADQIRYEGFGLTIFAFERPAALLDNQTKNFDLVLGELLRKLYL